VKTFAAEQDATQTEIGDLKSKQLELIIKTIEEKPKQKARKLSSL